MVSRCMRESRRTLRFRTTPFNGCGLPVKLGLGLSPADKFYFFEKYLFQAANLTCPVSK